MHSSDWSHEYKKPAPGPNNTLNLEDEITKLKGASQCNIYFLGNAGVGKSTSLNDIFKAYHKSSTQAPGLTMPFSIGSTTMFVNRFNLTTNVTLVDVPGIHIDEGISNYILTNILEGRLDYLHYSKYSSKEIPALSLDSKGPCQILFYLINLPEKGVGAQKKKDRMQEVCEVLKMIPKKIHVICLVTKADEWHDGGSPAKVVEKDEELTAKLTFCREYFDEVYALCHPATGAPEDVVKKYWAYLINLLNSAIETYESRRIHEY